MFEMQAALSGTDRELARPELLPLRAQARQVDHDRQLGVPDDHDDRLLVGGGFASRWGERRHADVVAGIGLQPHRFVAVQDTKAGIPLTTQLPVPLWPW
jgi:hypothetical protein